MQQSKSFKSIKQARQWAHNHTFTDIMYLIEDKENNQFSFVNESKLFYLQNCFVLDMDIVEVWE